tara:strand:+ start:3335 stop:4117 length:783 start_codon:yes stop_codon:yes gene_type:complete
LLYPRIIPCLLIKNNGLVKTVNFKNPKYVGDPINAVKIFNEKSVDELFILDIDATVKDSEPNYKMINNLAAESRMPLCYGGGIKTKDQALKILGTGVEKIALSSIIFSNPSIITQVSKTAGSQSVVVVLDVKKKRFSSKYQAYIENGSKLEKIDPIIFSSEIEKMGAGEIVLNCIDRDGMMNGYDLNLIEKVREKISIPLTIIGGAGNLKHLADVISNQRIIGLGVGSLFVFKGKYKAVLINYPNPNEKEKLIEGALQIK